VDAEPARVGARLCTPAVLTLRAPLRTIMMLLPGCRASAAGCQAPPVEPRSLARTAPPQELESRTVRRRLVFGVTRSMLVLSRKKNESIVIDGNIVITVVEIRGDKVRLGINAPKEVPIHRSEIHAAIQSELQQQQHANEETPPVTQTES
jgi:carbon storage regulator